MKRQFIISYVGVLKNNISMAITLLVINIRVSQIKVGNVAAAAHQRNVSQTLHRRNLKFSYGTLESPFITFPFKAKILPRCFLSEKIARGKT